MATKEEVSGAIARLMARLDGNEENVRSAIPGRKVMGCLVTDIGVSWYSVIEDGHVSPPTEDPPPGERVAVLLKLRSDDLIDLVEERISFLSAFLSGKVRVDASLSDLLRLRTLL
ncbi:MAG TPA: SCP2 sterol-binding domain-containing protein [Actinomycetota bacterium]|nr:SCP2 sterol-binding domain-containing protein [Actinomycetota bacterium]